MKRLSALILTILLFSGSLQAFAAVSTDASPWAVPVMTSAYEVGLVPEAYLQKARSGITRLEFCKIVLLFHEKTTGKKLTASGESPFGDTKDTDVVAAYEAGIIGGTSPGVFAPNDVLTREQMAIMIARTLSVCQVDLTVAAKAAPFTDTADLYESSKGYINRLYGAGIISGMTKDTFEPFRQLSTQEAVSAFLQAYRYFEKTTGAAVDMPATPEGTKPETTTPEATAPETVKPEPPATQPESVATGYLAVQIGAKSVSLGQTAEEIKKAWGEPDRVDETVYGLSRYIYKGDYSTYFFVTLQENKVVEIFVPGKGFTYLGNSGSSTSADIKNLSYISALEHSGIIKGEESIARLPLDYEGNITGVLLTTKVFGESDSLKSGVHVSLREDVEEELLDLIQVKRKEAGLPLLTVDAKLSTVALAHSTDMVTKNYFDYTGSDGSTPFSRILGRTMTFQTALEVIANQRGDVVNIYQDWMRSAAKLNGILDQTMTHVGIGAAERSKELYITVDLCGGLKHIS